MIKTYRWEEEAIKGIREHFTARNAARGRQGKRLYIRKRFVNLLPSGDIVHDYTYSGESVTATKRTYDTQVDFGR